MVAQYVKDMVDRFMRDGADTTDDLTWRRNWLSGSNSEDAYQQMYEHATRYYSDLEKKNQQAHLEAMRAQQDAFNRQMAHQTAQQNGLLSALASAYSTQAGHANQEFYKQAHNISSSYNASLGTTADRNNANSHQLQQQLQQLNQPKMQSLSFQGSGVNDQEIGHYQQAFGQHQQDYERGMGLISKFDPDSVSGMQQRYGQATANFNPTLGNLQYHGSLFDNTYAKNPINVNQTDVPRVNQEYQSSLQGLNNVRQTLLGGITSLGTLAQEALTRGHALEAKAKQSQLTYRNQYFANQSSRYAQRQSLMAEKAGANQVNVNRSLLSRYGVQ